MVELTFGPEVWPDERVDAGQEDREVGEHAVEAGEDGARALGAAEAATVGPLRAAARPRRRPANCCQTEAAFQSQSRGDI